VPSTKTVGTGAVDCECSEQPQRGGTALRGKVPSTKTVGTGAVHYDGIVALKGRHGFREEVASKAKG